MIEIDRGGALNFRSAADGYRIKKFKVTDGNCYEIYGWNKEGKKVEIYFNPVTGVILPATDGHPVKRVNYATEVNHDKQDRNQEDEPQTALAGVSGGSTGLG